MLLYDNILDGPPANQFGNNTKSKRVASNPVR